MYPGYNPRLSSVNGLAGYWVVVLPDEPLIGKLVKGSDGRLYLVLGDKAVPVEAEPRRHGAVAPVLRFELSGEMLERYRSWLGSRHRRRPVRDPETVEKYMGYLRKFYECSGGVVEPETIARCSTNKHYVRALRAFLEMLRFYGEVPDTVVSALLERLRWREGQQLAEDVVPVSEVVESVARCLERCRRDYRILYLAMLYGGGVRLEQLLELRPFEKRYWWRRGSRPRPYGRYNAPKALLDRGVASKPIDWLWLPENLFHKLLGLDPARPSPAAARMYYSKNRFVTATRLRSFCWQAAKYILGSELAMLLQGRVGELKRSVTATSYDALRLQLDKLYPKWVTFVDEIVKGANEPLDTARRLVKEYRLPLPA